MCEICSSRLKDALSFKSACLSNRDSANVTVKISEIKMERTEENSCNESCSMSVDEERCFLCVQLITERTILLSGNEDANSIRDLILKYIPELVSE